MPDLAFLNGEYLPLSEAKIPVTDYGFLFGYALYETMRTYDGRFFRLDDHLARLEKSAGTLEIPVDLPALKDTCCETARRSKYSAARVRITITPGQGTPAPNLKSCQRPTLLITAVRYVPQLPEAYAQGYRVTISSISRGSRSLLPGMKSSSNLESLRARQSARAAGAEEAIFLNERGCLAESSSANLFLYNGATLLTPWLGSGILPGVTRKVIFELANHLGLSCCEAELSRGELESAQEAFLTNSLIEIMPATYIDDQPVGSGKPGDITLQLMAAYHQQVKKETA